MSDDSLSASELRKNYEKGGAINDSELTASQLRARHGINSNSNNFSTDPNKNSSHNNQSINPAFLILILLVIIVLLVIFYQIHQNSTIQQQQNKHSDL